MAEKLDIEEVRREMVFDVIDRINRATEAMDECARVTQGRGRDTFVVHMGTAETPVWVRFTPDLKDVEDSIVIDHATRFKSRLHATKLAKKLVGEGGHAGAVRTLWQAYAIDKGAAEALLDHLRTLK